MKVRGYFYVGLTTTLNIILNAATFGNYLWLEGRVRGGVFRNWARRFRNRPERFVRPRTEEEIVELVRSSDGIRLYGSGHSFNSGVVPDHVLISLDDYSGVVRKDLAQKQMTFKGGTRMRDCIKCLLEDGLAFKALPSHDAQSIGGILSTDVHGTGRDWGFVNEAVVSLKVIDGRGVVHECVPSDDLFRAVIGGVGAVGIISEVVVQAVERFNVEQKVELSNIPAVEARLVELLNANEHFSLYLFPFTDICQINTWNRTPKSKSLLGPLREFIDISIDALLAAWIGNLMAYTGTLPRLSPYTHRLKRGTDLVLESNQAYSRTIYHLHQELEFTVPFADTFEMCRRFVSLYEEMFYEGLPYALFEVRFTPANHDHTLIGAGQERQCTWIDLVLDDSHGFEKYYAAAEQLVRETNARPHLGKFAETLRKEDMSRLYGANFDRFLQLRDEHDPERKFSNDFTRRIFGD
jgi:FAD/FMN-containing dehydrogenase